MFYIIKKSKTSPFTLVEVKNATDATYRTVKDSTFDIKGQFGRRDYAEAWCKYRNGEITMEQLNTLLDNE